MKITPENIYVAVRVVFSIALSFMLIRYFGSEIGFKNFGVFWVFTYPLIIVVVLANLVFNFKQIPKLLKLYNFLLLLVVIALPFVPEKAEEGLLLEAHLKEERSSWNVKIYEDKNYRVRRSDLGGFKDYRGEYLVENDTLIMEGFDCERCGFSTEWILQEKNLVKRDSILEVVTFVSIR